MNRRPKIGDLFEVRTAKGLGYIQYGHREGGGPLSKGALIRAIRGLHSQRPTDLEKLAAQPTLFWAYYPLGSALNQGLVVDLGPFLIPTEAAQFPILRSPGGIDKSGLVHDWNILGRDQEKRAVILRIVKILNDDEQRLSNAYIVSHSILVDWIEGQYRPENDPVMLRSVHHWTGVERQDARDAGQGEMES
jgi:hypothetical protein